MKTSAAAEISNQAESIHQEAVIKASRTRVYQALTGTKQFDRLTDLSGARATMSLGNSPTQIDARPGGAFTLFGGHIVGRQLELIPGERIVQAWRVVDWDPGIYSIAKFELKDQAGATKIIFDHTGFPVGLAEHLAAGWKTHYWEPLEKYFKS